MDRKKENSSTITSKSPEEVRRADERENLKAKINFLQSTLQQKETENKRLLDASKDLSDSNQALANSNTKLIEANEELTTVNDELGKANQKLVDANKKLLENLSPSDPTKPKKN